MVAAQTREENTVIAGTSLMLCNGPFMVSSAQVLHCCRRGSLDSGVPPSIVLQSYL